MFDVGFTEILLIGVVALVVIGPERLPDVARSAGKWINKTQRFVRGVRADIANELDSGELKKLLGDQREQIDELRKMVRSTARDIESSTHDVVRGARRKLDELEEATAHVEAEVDEEVRPAALPGKGGGTGTSSATGAASDGDSWASRDAPVGDAPAAAGSIAPDVGGGGGGGNGDGHGERPRSSGGAGGG